jgi:hypothetical protein
MSRRVTLPGADELFRTTATGERESGPPVRAVPSGAEAGAADAGPRPGPADRGVRRLAPAEGAGSAKRRPTGRERHEEKITVYLSPEELIDLERAKLTLRQEHRLAVDRGRIVREALALVLAELDARGGSSSLVRRLRDSG